MKKRKRGESISLHVGTELRHERIKALSPIERWTRIALKLLVADCPYRPVLCSSPGNPFTDTQIARHLMVATSAWKATKKKLVMSGEIEVDPKVGVRYQDWAGGHPFRHAPRKPVDLLPLSEKELAVHEELRVWLIERWNVILGHAYVADERLFIDHVERRISEGATRDDLDMGMRTFIWANANATPKINDLMRPYRAFRSHTFWKWVKMAMPAPVLRMQTTKEYMKGLPPHLRKRAREYASDYGSEIALLLRRNGWDSLYDADFTQVQTCKQYVMDRIEKEK
jgi:hypothetical protein